MTEIKQLMEHIEEEMAVYDHLHKRAITQAEKVGVLQALYNK